MTSLLKRSAKAAGPGQLALVMPIASVIGLMTVVSAAALGGSAHMVAILAVAGFALCGIAPMALIEVFVARPLRAAAERLRAARDGRALAEPAPRASGLVADLVNLADDVRAAHAHLSQYGAAIHQCEKLAAAGDEAIRAFRLHSEELAEATALGESQLRRASQSHFAEISEALKALRTALPANFEGAVERIESMLVYIGESFDRRESKDKIFESAFGRVDRSFADLGRLMAQETQNLQASLAGAAASLREDLAAQQAAQTELGQKIETAETRVLAKLFDLEAPDAARLIEAMRAESETTRRALREKIGELLAAPAADDRLAALERLTAEGFEATARMIDALPADAASREDIRSVADALARIEAAPPVDLAALSQAAEALAAEVSRLEAVAPAPDLAVALSERIEAVEARLVEPLETLRRDALERLDGLAAGSEALRVGLESLARPVEQAPVDLGPLAERIEATAQAQIERLEASLSEMAARLTETNHAPDFAPLGEALNALREGLQAAAEAQTAGLEASQQPLTALVERFDAFGADMKAAVAQTGTEGERLRAEIAALGDLLGEAVGALSAKLDETVKSQELRETAAGLSETVRTVDGLVRDAQEAVAAKIEAASQGQGEALAGLTAVVESVRATADVIVAADRGEETAAFADLVRGALETVASRVETASQSQGEALRDMVAALAAQDPRETLTGIAASIESLAGADRTAEIGALVREALETAASRFETAAQGQGEALREVSAALAAQDPREALSGLAATVEKLAAVDQASVLEAVAVRAEAASQAHGEVLREISAALAAQDAREAMAGLVSSLEAAQTADRMALESATARVEAALEAQGQRLWETSATLLGQDPREALASLAGAVEAVRATVAEQATTDRVALEGAAARFEAALQDQVERVSQLSTAVQTQDPRETLEGLRAMLAQLQSAVASLATADRAAESVALGDRIDETREAISRLDEATRAQAERLAAALAALAETGPEAARITQERVADIGQRLEGLAAASNEEIRAALLAVGSEIAALAEISREQAATATGRFDALDGAAERTKAEAQAHSEQTTAALTQAAADLAAEIRAAAQAQTQALAALDRDLFAGPLAALEATAGRLDGAADALAAERADVSGLRNEIAGASVSLAERIDALAQSEFVPAVAGLTTLNQDICKTATQLSASANALRIAVAGERPAFKDMRDDIAGLAAALATVARYVEERFGGLDGLLAQQVEAFARLEAALPAPDSAAPALAELGQRLEAFAEDQARRGEALEMRVAARAAALDRTSVASALTVFRAMTKSFAEAKTRLEETLAAFQPPEHGDAFLARFDAFAAAQNERLLALDLRLSNRSAGVERTSVAAALTVFRTITRELKEAVEALRAATALAPQPQDAPGFGADLDALGHSVASALARFDERLDALAADQTDRLTRLETRISQRAAQHNRTEVATALTVFRSLSRNLAEAVARFGAATEKLDALPDGSARTDDGEVIARIEALARTQEERLDALELRLATRGASFDRTAVSSALTAFRAMGQSLQDATARIEQASDALEAKAQSPLPAPDLSALAQEIAEIGGRLEALVAAPRQNDAGSDVMETLRDELRGLGSEVSGALTGFAARLDRAAEEAPALRAALDGLGARMAEALAETVRRVPAVGSASGPETKSPGALAKIVVSLADSLDFRFGQIEHSIAEVAEKWRDNVSSNEDVVAAEMTAVLKQVTAASEVLKSGLSDFIGVSAALVEDVNSNKRTRRDDNVAVAS